MQEQLAAHDVGVSATTSRVYIRSTLRHFEINIDLGSKYGQ